MGLLNIIADGNIIGVQCALGLQGYSTFMSEMFPICLYDGDKRLPGTPTFVGVKEMPTEDELVVVNGVTMTNPYRSVIDLINTNPYSEDSVLAVMTMMDNEEELKTMREVAKKYNVEKELDELIKEAEEWEF